ncbi:hypothetical protein PR048_018811 [Dryococelus australis]|uniref:Leucine-rich repeat-containing protein 51 n=1 Tax=Dryococelus australis TaxID=614101 RepID=A0ABQ9H1P3_9NEOP|nr:hypothetical protein PR048_018811 [Dryococelus australis]
MQEMSGDTGSDLKHCVLLGRKSQLQAHTMQQASECEASSRDNSDGRHRMPGDVQEVLRLSPPLDFSFMGLMSLEEVGLYEPRASRVGGIPPQAHSGRYLSPALWLSYNCLHSASGLAQLISELFQLPHMLAWVDLSFNRLETVPVEDLMELKGLRTLYLHANRLHSMQQVCELRNSAGLRSLTLHGNPLQVEPSYRQQVLVALPQLTSLDFCLVLSSERPIPVPLDTSTSSDSLS